MWFLDDLLVLARSPDQYIRNTHKLMEFTWDLTSIGIRAFPGLRARLLIWGLSLDMMSVRTTLTQERGEATMTALMRCVPALSTHQEVVGPLGFVTSGCSSRYVVYEEAANLVCSSLFEIRLPPLQQHNDPSVGRRHCGFGPLE